MRRPNPLKNWKIGQKTMASHLLIACLSIVIATVLCYLFGYQYTRTNAIEELERQVTVIARKESNSRLIGSDVHGTVVEMYQQLTNAAVFFVNRDGEAVRMKRYVSPGGVQAPATENSTTSQEMEYSTVELFDAIDRQFVDRILAGETVTAVRRFVFADGVVVFAGAPVMDDDGDVGGGIILAQPVEIMRAISRELGTTLFFAACIAIVLAVILAICQTRMLVRPVMRMTRVARKMADGDYNHRIAHTTNDEIGELGRTLNTLSLRLMETIESLREERDQLELVIGSIGEGILAVDEKMQAVHYNMSFLSMMELESVDSIHEEEREDMAMLVRALRLAMDTRENSRVSLCNPSGRALLAEVTALSGTEAGRIGAVCLLADVSEAQRMEQLRRDYVANISHELRTPLTGILGSAGLLMGPLEENVRQELVQDIYQDAQWLVNLVENVLSVTRMEDGRLSINLTPQIIDEIVDEALTHVMSKKTVKRESDGELLIARADAQLLTQVIVNLVNNAYGHGGENVNVCVRTYKEGDFAVIQVADDGVGVPDEAKQKIFDLFYTTDGTGDSRKGLGVGLALCRSIIRAHGGTIDVTDASPHGAVFTIRLAAVNVEAQEG